MTSFYDKEIATELVGRELAKRGWKLSGFHKTESDPMTDYYSQGFWCGEATNDKFPGVVIHCWRKSVPKGKMIAVYKNGLLISSFTGFYLANSRDEVPMYVDMIEKSVGSIQQNKSPATTRQLWYLHVLTKRDTRNWVLTVDQASELINKIKSGQSLAYDSNGMPIL